MADDKDAAAKKAADDAKKAKEEAKEEAVKESENHPQPYPTQEQLDRIKAGESADDVLGTGPDEPGAKPAPKPAARAMEADKPAGYQTR